MPPSLSPWLNYRLPHRIERYFIYLLLIALNQPKKAFNLLDKPARFYQIGEQKAIGGSLKTVKSPVLNSF